MSTCMLHVMSLIACLILTACASDRPSVSGVNLFGTHTVVQGDEVVITLPYDPELGTEWEITSFDSAMLQPLELPRLVESGGGRFKYQVRALARLPGETEIVFMRRYAEPGSTFTDNEARVKVQILERPLSPRPVD